MNTKYQVRIFLAINQSWSTLSLKLKKVQELYESKIEFREITTHLVSFTDIPFKSYDKRNLPEVKRDWYTDNLIPLLLGQHYDAMCFVVPEKDWKSPGIFGFRGYKEEGIWKLQVGGINENDNVYFSDGTSEDAFVTWFCHELGHFLCAELEIEDKVHDFFKKENMKKEDMKSFVDWLQVPQPKIVEQERYFSIAGILDNASVPQFVKDLILYVLGIKTNKTLELIAEDASEDTLYVPRKNKIEAFAWAIFDVESNGGRKDSLASRLNNPGAVRWAGQKNAVPYQTATNGVFAKFNTWDDGFQYLMRMLTNAATGVSKIYKPTHTIYEFFSIYAPSTDKNKPHLYAERVAGKIGVSPNAMLKNLV